MSQNFWFIIFKVLLSDSLDAGAVVWESDETAQISYLNHYSFATALNDPIFFNSHFLLLISWLN